MSDCETTSARDLEDSYFEAMLSLISLSIYAKDWRKEKKNRCHMPLPLVPSFMISLILTISKAVKAKGKVSKAPPPIPFKPFCVHYCIVVHTERNNAILKKAMKFFVQNCATIISSFHSTMDHT